MSELINTHQTERNLRLSLLSTVSAATLLVSLSGATASSSTDRPTVWIELGGQFERVEAGQQIFSPPFFAGAVSNVLVPMVDAQKQSQSSFGEHGKIIFEPADTNWLVSASIAYGRSNATRHLHYETARQTVPVSLHGLVQTGLSLREFGDGQGDVRESHLVLDFQAGKDVGLGLFGTNMTSIISAGVRFAQFSTGSNVTLHARPTYVSTVLNQPGKYTFRYRHFHTNTAILQSRRSVHAIGPAASWDVSVPLAGDKENMKVALDWGVNAAVLFGRQRTQSHHQTAGFYSKAIYPLAGAYHATYVNPPIDHNRSRSVTVPNVGGFAGVSFRYANAKVSFGYRGDFFFNAMDTGWDTHKSSTIGFYGPFASISIGLGG